jgi:hypothetical protein
MYDHWQNMLAGKPHSHIKLYRKLTSIFRSGYTAPIYERLLECEDEQACFLLERFMIKTFERENLCNLTDGGEGFSGGTHSDETRQKMKENHVGMTGRIHTDGTRKKQSKASIGKPKSKEHCQALRRAHVGIPLNENHCKHIGDAHRGKPKSAKSNQKRRESLLGREHSKERCLKNREGHLGKTRSKASCQKQSETIKRKRLEKETFALSGNLVT